jgi:acylphosphatase
MIYQADINVSGTVQGVCFRSEAIDKARELNITGWIKNEPDETVSVCAQGKMATLNKFIDWCRVGPHEAEVKNLNVKITQNPEEIPGEFSVKY